MTILNDKQITKLAVQHNMITPFIAGLVKDGVISYGLSSYGYDPRLAREFKIFKPQLGVYDKVRIIDPKNFYPNFYEEVVGDEVYVPANGFVLARTVEEFHIPDDVFGLVISKSTYARCGIICNVTPLEPGSKGTVTLEYSNTTSHAVKMYAGEGACQFIFFKGEKAMVNYASRNGKYMNQTKVTNPKLES